MDGAPVSTRSGTSAIDQVRERIDIVDLIGEQVQLRKTGRTFKGLCPFHQEKTPSFVVYPENQTFHCFGCGRGGDVFSFVMQQEHVDFRQALEELAKRAGVELAPLTPGERRPPVEQFARLYELNGQASRFFTHVLWSTNA